MKQAGSARLPAVRSMATEFVKLNVLACTEGSVTLNFSFESFGDDSVMQSPVAPAPQAEAPTPSAVVATAPPADLLGDLLGDFSDAPAPAAAMPPPGAMGDMMMGGMMGDDLLGDFGDAPAPATTAAMPPPGAMMMGDMMGDDLLSLLDAPAQAPSVAADADAAERQQGDGPVGEEEVTLELTPDAAPELAKPQLV